MTIDPGFDPQCACVWLDGMRHDSPRCYEHGTHPELEVCICPPEFCLGAPDQDGIGTVDCGACLALDPEDTCLRESLFASSPAERRMRP